MYPTRQGSKAQQVAQKLGHLAAVPCKVRHLHWGTVAFLGRDAGGEQPINIGTKNGREWPKPLSKPKRRRLTTSNSRACATEKNGEGSLRQ